MDSWPDRFPNRLRPWEPAEIAKLSGLLGKETPYPVMAVLLGRSQESIRTKARKIGLIGQHRARADVRYP